MKRGIVMLLVLASQLAMAGEEFTAGERQALNDLVVSLESSCREGMQGVSSKIPENAPALARWMGQITQSADYCPCTMRHVRDKMTPALMRSGTEEELKRLITVSGTECILPVFKSTYRGMCLEMLAEIEKVAVKASVPGPEMCDCVQADIDQVTVDSYAEYHRKSLEDYREYQRTRVPPTAGNSIVASMNRCGWAKVRKK
jgi:hypothetical protein